MQKNTQTNTSSRNEVTMQELSAFELDLISGGDGIEHRDLTEIDHGN